MRPIGILESVTTADTDWASRVTYSSPLALDDHPSVTML